MYYVYQFLKRQRREKSDVSLWQLYFQALKRDETALKGEAMEKFAKMPRLHSSVYSENDMHKAFNPEAEGVSLYEKYELRWRYFRGMMRARKAARKG